MRSWTTIRRLMVVGGIGVALAGCQNDSGSGSRGTQAAVTNTAQPVNTSGAMRVTMGPAPMQQLIAAGGHLRIMDVTTGSLVLKVDIPPNSIVRIDEVTGVTIGRKNPVLGPLPAGHEYEIWLDRR
jgi:hypothetical protein